MPEYLGVIGAASGAPAVLADADLILLIGSHVDYRVGYMKPPAISAQARVVRIDRDPAELNQGVLPDVGILGDPRMVLHQVWEEWLRRHLSTRAGWLREAQGRNQRFRARWAQPPASSPMTMSSAVSRAVSSRIGEPEPAARRRRTSENPSIPGSITSSTKTSNCSACAADRPSCFS